MNQLSFGLVLLWGFSIVTTVFIIAYIDSYDCSQFENGWDETCLDINELHKEHLLQVVPVTVVILSAVLIILGRYNFEVGVEE